MKTGGDGGAGGGGGGGGRSVPVKAAGLLDKPKVSPAPFTASAALLNAIAELPAVFTLKVTVPRLIFAPLTGTLGAPPGSIGT